MLGLINDCAEQLVITKFGLDAWHAIKEAASCTVKDHGFEQHGHYPDSATVDIVVAASQALSVTVDDVLELFGQFFLQYTIDKGYDNLLRCQGSTLRLWLSNLNAMHDHLQSSMPAGNFPVFWCENCEEYNGSIILHYFSIRGALLCGVVVGITKEVAKTYFDVEVDMIKLETQGEGGSECTTWRISATDPKKKHKLTMEHVGDDSSVVKETMNRRQHRRATLQHSNRGSRDGLSRGASSGETTETTEYGGRRGSVTSSVTSASVSFALDPLQHTGCPFSGAGGAFSNFYEPASKSGGEETEDLGLKKMMARALSSDNLRKLAQDNAKKKSVLYEGRRHSTEDEIHRRECYSHDDDDEGGAEWQSSYWSCSHGNSPPPPRKEKIKIEKKSKSSSKKSKVMNTEYQHGLTSSKVRSIFPYHVMVDENFKIVQVGRALPDMLLRDYDDLIGLNVDNVIKITRPILAGFDWPTLQRLADQKFFLTPVPFDDEKTGARIEASDIKFKGNIIQVTNGGAMFVLSPDAENITELNRMGLTMSDLPLHSFQRDVVFLGEHIASEVRTAHKLDRLSKRLEREKNLSNTLLNSMLPAPVAESMRAGKTVDPRLYENVTLFFSDVVGFTEICDVVEPWDVIDMLNQLYTVMDHLASHFNLYKVETIGDAYMCCSGMPTPDDMHAQNIANFALAVTECVHLVKSPADGKPVELRIGIHTGHCMGGVVGTLTPHYCLFGDMVNTTARHESTGMSGKIQCSSVLYEHLAEHSAESQGPLYDFQPRGFIEMKGKGRCYTYWLDKGTKFNTVANPDNIKQLKGEVKSVLSKKKWFKRRYFGFSKRKSNEFFLSGDASLGMTSFGDMSSVHDDGSITTAGDSSRKEDAPVQIDAISRVTSRSSMVDGKSRSSDHDTHSFTELKRTQWSEIKWTGSRPRIDMVAATHGLLSSMLWKCVAQVQKQLPENHENLDSDLLRFVDRISTLYEGRAFHNWDHACQVVLSATFLIKEYHKAKDDIDLSVEHNPFVRFITVFAALIHDVKHVGMPNAQLEKANHCLCSVYGGSYLERQSIQIGLGIFIEDFPDLSTFVLQMCPEFLHLVTSAVLATDVSSQEIQKKIQDRFERVVILSDEDLSEFEKTQTVVEQILLLADVGHCSQSYDIFLNWNAAFFKECLDNWWAGHGDDPRPGWYNGQIGFIEGYILPLAERCGTLVPHCQLAEGARRIVRKWKKSGEAFTQQLVKQSAIEDEQRALPNNNVKSEVESSAGNGETSTKINGETSRKQATTNQKRKKSKMWKLLPWRSSRSLSPSPDNRGVQTSERRSSNSIASSTRNRGLQKNQSPKPNEDSVNLLEEDDGLVDEDQAYRSFLEFISGKPIPEAAPAAKNGDSFEPFLDVVHDKAIPDATPATAEKTLSDDDSLHFSSSSH